MVEISEGNLNEHITNEEVETIINEEIEPMKRGRGRPTTIKPIEEPTPKIGKKRIITAEWRYKENGKYITCGYKDREYHKQCHLQECREHVRIGWTCPYCNSNHVSNEHKKKHWAANRCRKIQEEKGLLIIETIQEMYESILVFINNIKIIKCL